MAKQRIRSNRRRPANKPHDPRYNAKTLRKDREYGFYWYSWLWSALRPMLVFFSALIVVAGIVATGINYVNTHYFMAVTPGDEQMTDFVVERGSSITKISENLEKEGFIRSKTIFKTIISLRGSSNSIQYGTYPLSRDMDVNKVISVLTAGTATEERTITIIPGWSINDIADYLKKAGAIKDTTSFTSLCNNAEAYRNDYYAVEQALSAGKMAGRLYQLEGYLAPDTYRIYSNASAEDILKVLLKQMNTVYDGAFYQLDNTELVYDESGELVEKPKEDRYQTTLSPDETLILASVIEREAGQKSDFAKVSAVFHNRLNSDMALESDATIAYALGINRMILTGSELSTASPYNTYLNKGLPQGPICNPSLAAIQAALNPDLSYISEGYLFFCATDPKTSELHFSKTKEEHEAAVAQYRPLWEAYDQTKQGQ